jgi:hypothetical protein
MIEIHRSCAPTRDVPLQVIFLSYVGLVEGGGAAGAADRVRGDFLRV